MEGYEDFKRALKSTSPSTPTSSKTLMVHHSSSDDESSMSSYSSTSSSSVFDSDEGISSSMSSGGSSMIQENEREYRRIHENCNRLIKQLLMSSSTVQIENSKH